MADITPFNFGAHTVRVVAHNDQPWFVATDVANTLGYRSAPDASRHLDDDEKGTQIVRTPGGDQKLTIISESGLYALVLRSRKPEARKFAKWVTSEVLPSIRQTGGYGSQQRDVHLVEHAHQLAHTATLQVYQAVFDAVMLEGEAPHSTRMLLSFTRGAGGAMTPYVQPIEAGAMVMTLAQLTQAVRTDLIVSDTTLARLAAACTQRMATRAELQALKQVHPEQTAQPGHQSRLQLQ